MHKKTENGCNILRVKKDNAVRLLAYSSHHF